MKLLNLGCGQRFHSDWINIDFVSADKTVITHDLSNGIPFDDNSFDVIYHSHILEHFSKMDAFKFSKECFRVLNVNGIIRIAVPDLEIIVKQYLHNLNLATAGDPVADSNYEWIKLELFDQMVRNETGGEMYKYLVQETIPNEDYVYQRIGNEARKIRRDYFEMKKNNTTQKLNINNTQKAFNFKKSLRRFIERTLMSIFLNNKSKSFDKNQKEIKIGKFRTGGETHQWMYDRYSLEKLLNIIGFKDIQIKTPFESDIHGWNSYGLDVDNEGLVYKPDSLFIEAKKY